MHRKRQRLGGITTRRGRDLAEAGQRQAPDLLSVLLRPTRLRRGDLILTRSLRQDRTTLVEQDRLAENLDAPKISARRNREYLRELGL